VEELRREGVEELRSGGVEELYVIWTMKVCILLNK
jgi:hypothetical protein